MAIADLKPGVTDPMGDRVTVIHGIKPPEYAVYSTDRRLLVWYSDEPAESADQRKGLSPLGPLRGEINGLIDGWRTSRWASLRSKVARYDRRVADALLVALEHDVDGAKTILAEIKQDVFEDRTGRARLEYLCWALSFSLAAVAVDLSLAGGGTEKLWHAAAAGGVGAFFSLALNIRTRTILPDLSRIANITDASLRIIIGFIGASVLMALVVAKVVTLSLGDAGDQALLFPLIVGFLAGFSERLVPDLLSKAAGSATLRPPGPATGPELPAADAGKVAAAASAAVANGAAGAAGGQAGAPAVPAVPGGDVPPPRSQEEAHVDHCLCDVETGPEEVTRDEELPPASGGVAAGQTGRVA